MHALASTPTRRDHIVMVASRIFGAVGYRKTTLQLIADEFGLTRPALYHYFKSKQEILEEIYDRQMAVIDESVREVAEQTTRPIEFLQLYAVRHAQWIAANQLHGGVFWREESELSKAKRQQVAEWRRTVHLRLRGIVEDAQRDGDLRDDIDAELIIDGLFGMLNWMYRWFRLDKRYTPELVGSTFWDMLVNGIRQLPEPTSDDGRDEEEQVFDLVTT